MFLCSYHQFVFIVLSCVDYGLSLIIYFNLVFIILSSCKKNLDIGLTFDFTKTIFFFFIYKNLKIKGTKFKVRGKWNLVLT